MDDQQQQDGVELQQQQRPRKVQLGEFWPQAPNAWFATADLKLEVAHITSERERIVHAVGAMGFNMLCAVLDLVETPPAVDPYTTLKGCLVMAHQLTPVQKATRCLQVVASPDQWPSEVLALLLEFCPAGEEPTAFFRAALTMRLPVTIQAHLTGTEFTNIKELAQLADRLWQCHGPQAVAAVPVDDRQTPVRCLPQFRPRDDPSRSKGASRAITKASRASKWPVASLARREAASSCAPSMPNLARMLSFVWTRRTAPGQETKWPGGGGCRLLGPQRPTGPTGG